MDEFDKAVSRRMKSKVTARKNGQTTQVILREAQIAKLAETALNGNSIALRQILQLDLRTAEREAAVRLAQREVLLRLRDQQQRRLDTAIAKGEDTDSIA